MGAGGTLEGRMLSTAGEATVYDVLITLPSCAITPLPVGLLSFTGYCDNHNNVLQWRTASETNNDYFSVERSLDGINWHIAGTVTGSGNSSSPLNYTFTDVAHHEGITYYRLNQTDFNGNYKYEDIIDVNNCEEEETDHFTIYPNPSEGKFELLFDGNSGEISSIDIINSQGQSIRSTSNFQSTFDLSNNAPGCYFVRVQQKSEVTSLKFVLY